METVESLIIGFEGISNHVLHRQPGGFFRMGPLGLGFSSSNGPGLTDYHPPPPPRRPAPSSPRPTATTTTGMGPLM